jgi:hypothetical protein
MRARPRVGRFHPTFQIEKELSPMSATKIVFDPGDDWTDSPDGELRFPQLSALQGLSRALQADSPNYVEGAAVGMLLLTGGEGGPKLFPASGVEAQCCAAFTVYRVRDPEGSLIDTSLTLPAGAKWRENPANPTKKMFATPDGDRVETTRLIYVVVDGVLCVMPLAKTALRAADSLIAMADATKIKLNAHEVAHVGLKVRVSTASESDGKNRWVAYRFTRLGVYPDRAGPKLDDVVKAAESRVALKKRFGEDLAAAKAEALAAAPKPPAIEYDGGPADKMTIESGRKPEFDDEIPWS